MILQLCGLSGSGKTSLSNAVQLRLTQLGYNVEIIDGDEYRKTLCPDLGFSKEDRNNNIRRLAFVASRLSSHGIISILCAINPYEEIRKEVEQAYFNVKTIYISCALNILQKRDTKGLYKRASLPEGHPEKLNNLSGINDPFDIPVNPDLVITTSEEPIEVSAEKLLLFIVEQLVRNGKGGNRSVGIGAD